MLLFPISYNWRTVRFDNIKRDLPEQLNNEGAHHDYTALVVVISKMVSVEEYYLD
jgi:hypothetical protein